MISRILAGLALLSGLIASPAYAGDGSIEWKTESAQSIPNNKWVTLQFPEGSAMPIKSGRALYSVQVRIDCQGKAKPRYVKIRLSRIKPDGKRDTTATNTWVWTKRGPSVFYASHLWQINARHPVEAQIKIVGGACHVVTTRQFKQWQPLTDAPV